MKEKYDILSAYDQYKLDELPCALITLVHVEGSAYRRAGARMLVNSKGELTGSISGGCLEGDALRKALLAIEQQEKRLITYDTSDEEDAVIGAQLGCEGIIRVLIEPLDYGDKHNPVELLRLASQSARTSILVTFFGFNLPSNLIGTSILDDGDHVYRSQFIKMDSIPQMAKEIESTVRQGQSRYIKHTCVEGDMYAYVEVIPSPIHLVIVGAGNDAIEVSQLALQLGWRTSIIDGRPHLANPNRFASTCQVMVSKPERLLTQVNIDEHSVFVLITHNFNYDLAVLKLIYNRLEIPYIGILGPKKKFNLMLEKMEEEGITLTTQQAQRIYAPVGLDIGAETPAEIALSILSEIQLVVNRANGQHLRDRLDRIHSAEDNSFTLIRSN